MQITGVIWLRNIVDKLAWKHQVTTDEVEEVLNNSPRYKFTETGNIEGENLYVAFGRTDAGRYLSIFFVHKTSGEALIISARDMTRIERKSYAKK
jgi:uncharacterized DUF497 family protein